MFMNNYKLTLLIMKNKAKLGKMIETDTDYQKILKQSKKLDNLIVQKIKNQMQKV